MSGVRACGVIQSGGALASGHESHDGGDGDADGEDDSDDGEFMRAYREKRVEELKKLSQR